MAEIVYPREHPNFSRGLATVELSGLGPKTSGKVRDMWEVEDKIVIATTDRISAYDRSVGTIPGKGEVLNLLSAFWFEQTQDIIPNHALAVPHPNILIARKAQETLPVEVVLRKYMAKSSTSTSVFDNYMTQKRRNIYGIDFPEGLVANQEFPMGTIITPTTKADQGHDEELTSEQAKKIVDSRLGKGMWNKTRDAAMAIFERGTEVYAQSGLILADTKYEFGIDEKGELMLIDEVHTPDSSRLWLASSYAERFAEAENPETFDKEILRRWLVEPKQKKKFREGGLPIIPDSLIQKMVDAYRVPYEMVTHHPLPTSTTNSEEIQEKVQQALSNI
jgi:phosphoribosylaminoimidazole-succinocarboxamide synthase